MASKLTGTLHWTKVPRKRPQEYLLANESETVARLAWQKTGGSLAVGEAPAGTWSFKRSGFLSTRVTVRTPHSDEDIATYYPHMGGGGRIEFRDGGVWSFRAKGFLSAHYELVDVAGNVPVKLKVQGFGTGGELQCDTARLDEKTAYLLCLLIWYVSLLAKEDAAAAAVLVCCT